MNDSITIKISDLTKENVCAVVNAANSSLFGGGGLDGAIHRAGGSEILNECRKIRESTYKNGLPAGEAVSTTAGNMKAKCVIHTVGPIYGACSGRCEDLLEACYVNSLHEAVRLGCDSIAFPAISTGIYGYPKDEAANIAFNAVEEFLKTHNIKVYFVFHSKSGEEAFKKAIGL